MYVLTSVEKNGVVAFTDLYLQMPHHNYTCGKTLQHVITESHQTLRRTDLLGLAMNFPKLFIFTLAGIALSGFSTLPNGVNAASIEDRDATMRGGTETTWIISVPSNFTCEQVSPETFLMNNIQR